VQYFICDNQISVEYSCYLKSNSISNFKIVPIIYHIYYILSDNMVSGQLHSDFKVTYRGHQGKLQNRFIQADRAFGQYFICDNQISVEYDCYLKSNSISNFKIVPIIYHTYYILSDNMVSGHC